jgi:hypothetical protein
MEYEELIKRMAALEANQQTLNENQRVLIESLTSCYAETQTNTAALLGVLRALSCIPDVRSAVHHQLEAMTAFNLAVSQNEQSVAEFEQNADVYRQLIAEHAPA